MDSGSEYIIGRNSVKAAVKSGQQIDCVYVAKGAETKGSLRDLIKEIKDRRILLKEVSSAKLDELCKSAAETDGAKVSHQGVIAQIPAFHYSELEDIFALAQKRREDPFVVILENVQDPHNLGAIIRSAEALGAHGVITGKRRSASLTMTTYKAACGAAQYIPIVRVLSINQTIEQLKKRGLWIAGADMDGMPLAKSNLTGPLGLVIGGESSGVSRLTKELCDFTVGIRLTGETPSLNASCAAAILIYEKRRQDVLKQHREG